MGKNCRSIVGLVVVALVAVGVEAGCGPAAPARSVERSGSFEEPAFDGWSAAESALQEVARACMTGRGPGSFVSDPDGHEPNDAVGCVAKWKAVPQLPADGVEACREVAGARTEWYAGSGSTRQHAEVAMRGFASGGAILATRFQGDTISGGGSVMVVRSGKVDDEFVEPIDRAVNRLRERIDEPCARRLERPAQASPCLRELASLDASSDEPRPKVKNPFPDSDGLVFRSPGCFARAARVEREARARRDAAVKELRGRKGPALEAARGVARLDACREPQRSDDCEAATSYLELLQRFEPTSSEVAEVTALLASARPKLDARKDDEDWAKVGVDGCAVPSTESSCEAVRRYLARRPTGNHAGEANAALRRAEPKLRALVAKREAEERVLAAQRAAEEAREEARRRREEALERARPKPRARETSSGRSCLPKEQWRANGNEVETDVIYTDTQGIVLWCQDGSGKGCVERQMEQRGQFTLLDVYGMAASCCCQVMD